MLDNSRINKIRRVVDCGSNCHKTGRGAGLTTAG